MPCLVARLGSSGISDCQLAGVTMLPGEITRSVWRRVDIEQALASYIYATTAAGGEVDMHMVKALCLSFGIDIKDVAQRVQAIEGK